MAYKKVSDTTKKTGGTGLRKKMNVSTIKKVRTPAQYLREMAGVNHAEASAYGQKLSSVEVGRKRTPASQRTTASPISKGTALNSSAPVGRTNVGTQISKPSGIQYVKTTPPTAARTSLKAALLKNKKKKG